MIYNDELLRSVIQVAENLRKTEVDDTYILTLVLDQLRSLLEPKNAR